RFDFDRAQYLLQILGVMDDKGYGHREAPGDSSSPGLRGHEGGRSMDVGGASGVGGAGRIEGARNIDKPKPPASIAQPAADKVELSNHAKIISDALSLPSVRADKIDEVKKLIQSGQFDTDARLDAALDRFLAENRDAIGE